MKKTIFLFSLVAGAFVAKAQTATLNVVLHPVQSIVVNTANAEVDLVYDDATKYDEGVTAVVSDHLQVYSTGGFEVSVSVPAANIGNDITTGTGSAETIAASGITVQAADGSTTNTGSDFTPGAVALSTTAVPLFSSSTGGSANKYNVTYKGAGSDAYVGKHFNGTSETTYTTEVTYSIVAN